MVTLVLLSLKEAVVIFTMGGTVGGSDVVVVDVDTVVVVVKSGLQLTVFSLKPGVLRLQV